MMNNPYDEFQQKADWHRVSQWGLFSKYLQIDVWGCGMPIKSEY